jgi:hypothetical protein
MNTLSRGRGRLCLWDDRRFELFEEGLLVIYRNYFLTLWWPSMIDLGN